MEAILRISAASFSLCAMKFGSLAFLVNAYKVNRVRHEIIGNSISCLGADLKDKSHRLLELWLNEDAQGYVTGFEKKSAILDSKSLIRSECIEFNLSYGTSKPWDGPYWNLGIHLSIFSISITCIFCLFFGITSIDNITYVIGIASSLFLSASIILDFILFFLSQKRSKSSTSSILETIELLQKDERKKDKEESHGN